MSRIGIDEVGRGCWAGPLLVVAARAHTSLPVGIKDSKVLNKRQRELFIQPIITSCDLGDGWVEPWEIDTLGLANAMRTGVKRALTNLGASFVDEIIMDGASNYCPFNFTNVKCMVRADSCVPIVSVASIYAKVIRDRYMSEQAINYPGYAFEKHVGYGTAAHSTALKKLGVSQLHRLSYKPVKAFIV